MTKTTLRVTQASPNAWDLWQCGERVGTIRMTDDGAYTTLFHPEKKTRLYKNKASAVASSRRILSKHTDNRLRPIKARVIPPTGTHRGLDLIERVILLDPLGNDPGCPPQHVSGWVWYDGWTRTYIDRHTYDKSKTPTIQENNFVDGSIRKYMDGVILTYDSYIKWV